MQQRKAWVDQSIPFCPFGIQESFFRVIVAFFNGQILQLVPYNAIMNLNLRHSNEIMNINICVFPHVSLTHIAPDPIAFAGASPPSPSPSSSPSSSPSLVPTPFSSTSVRKSSIHGWGLFANGDFPSNTIVIEYTGKLVKEEEIDTCTYLVHVVGDKYVDAASITESSDARYVNTAPHCKQFWNTSNKITNNCYFDVINIEGVLRVFIVTKRRVAHGEEFLVSYGPGHWKSTQDKKDKYVSDSHAYYCQREEKEKRGVQQKRLLRLSFFVGVLAFAFYFCRQ
jgi:hypothetical protein